MVTGFVSFVGLGVCYLSDTLTRVKYMALTTVIVIDNSYEMLVFNQV